MVTWYGQADVPREVSGRRADRSPFIQYKYIVNKTTVKLSNYKSNDLPTNGLPTRAWRRQPSHQLDKVAFIEQHWDYNTTIAPLNIYGVKFRNA